jgi:hypothetical protein
MMDIELVREALKRMLRDLFQRMSPATGAGALIISQSPTPEWNIRLAISSL